MDMLESVSTILIDSFLNSFEWQSGHTAELNLISEWAST